MSTNFKIVFSTGAAILLDSYDDLDLFDRDIIESAWFIRVTDNKIMRIKKCDSCELWFYYNEKVDYYLCYHCGVKVNK